MSRMKVGDRIYFDMFFHTDGRMEPTTEYPGTLVDYDSVSKFWQVDFDDGKFENEYWPEDELFLQSDYNR